MVAVQHPAWSHRSVEGEFVLTWSRLQERRSRSRAYRELSAQLGRYEREPYPALRAVGVLADTFCLGWRRTALTLEAQLPLDARSGATDARAVQF